MKSLAQHITESLQSVNEARSLPLTSFDENFVKMWNYANGFKHNTEYPNSFIAHYLYINGENAGVTNMSVEKFINDNKNQNLEIVKIEKRKPYASAKSMHVVDFKLGKNNCSIYSKVKITQ